MSARSHLVVPLLVVVTSGCGRIGYDEILGLGGPGGSTGGAHSSPDSGSVGDGGAGNGGSGGASGGRTAAGGTDSGVPGGGGSRLPDASAGGTDASSGNGGAQGSGGTTAGDGAAGSDGAIGIDAALGTGGTIGSGGTVGTGGAVGDAGIVGCADGQREGFLDVATYPAIAACAGGFAQPGVVGLIAPTCGRTAGDDGVNPDGSGCSALDLCAAAFHICSSAAEVESKSPTGCTGAAVGATPVFFITAQSGAGQRNCGPTGVDDVFGCGSLGGRPVSGSNCAPLDRWSINLCTALTAPWSCGSDETAEGSNVVKIGPAAGGVLCCHD